MKLQSLEKFSEKLQVFTHILPSLLLWVCDCNSKLHMTSLPYTFIWKVEQTEGVLEQVF